MGDVFNSVILSRIMPSKWTSVAVAQFRIPLSCSSSDHKLRESESTAPLLVTDNWCTVFYLMLLRVCMQNTNVESIPVCYLLYLDG